MKYLCSSFLFSAGLVATQAFLLLPTPSPAAIFHKSPTAVFHTVSPAIVDEADKADIPVMKDVVPVSALEAIDLRSGRVVLADYVPDPSHDNKPSRKYLSLIVDIGLEKRKVVAAVRSIFDPEDIIGKAVLIAVNTEPEVVLGLPSQGRIMYISHYSKQPMPRTLRDLLLSPGAPPPGSTIRGA